MIKSRRTARAAIPMRTDLHGKFNVSVSGTSFHQERLREISLMYGVSQNAVLIPDINNEYDDFAVQVRVDLSGTTERIGWLPRDINHLYHKALAHRIVTKRQTGWCPMRIIGYLDPAEGNVGVRLSMVDDPRKLFSS